ncbi:hypothetical protein C9980_13800 [Vibrio mediterranei]|uniref:hypothetical protein n=1 Tax=Vibrio mediterranei TaxID=689 RepID=UPI000D17F708|nr:hypothetical protein [Vibrio mediterranei]PTC04298.1 hypothetical protein C9980_13800 [Vibrio mediterranei]
MNSRDKIDGLLLSIEASITSDEEWLLLKELNPAIYNELKIVRALLGYRSKFESIGASMSLLEQKIEV